MLTWKTVENENEEPKEDKWCTLNKNSENKQNKAGARDKYIKGAWNKCQILQVLQNIFECQLDKVNKDFFKWNIE